MNAVVALIVLAVLPAEGQQASAERRHVEVRLRDGSVYSGTVCGGLSDRFFRFKVGSPSCYMVITLEWDQLESVRVTTELLEGQEIDAWRTALLRSLANSTDKRAARLTEPGQPEQSPPQPARSDQPSTPRLMPIRADRFPPPIERRVAAVQINAAAANWDADSDWDGLELSVRPIDRFGRLRPVRARVTVLLRAMANQFRWRSGPAGVPEVRLIGRWSRWLRPEQYRFGAARLLLPFGPDRPEPSHAPWHPNWSIGPYGRVEVQLDVPGQGCYYALSDFPVRIRRFSPIGDWLFLDSGSRSR